MIKLLRRFIKPYYLPFIFIIILLFAQASFDLKLPDYMSNIVNYGIQQKGIEDASVLAIRASEMDKIILLSDDTQKTLIEDNYQLIDQGDSKYTNKYPEVINQDIYILNLQAGINSDDITQLMAKSLLIKASIDSGQIDLTKLGIPANSDFYAIISTIDSDKLNLILKAFNSQFDKLDNNAINQAAINEVISEYQMLGINTNQIQIDYIYHTGLMMLLIAFSGMICAILVSFLGSKVASGIAHDVRGKIFEKIESFSNTEFDQFSIASLITRTSNDVTQIQMIVIMLSRVIFYAPILGIGAIWNVLNTDVNMVWVIGLGIVAMCSLITTMFIFVIPKFKLIQKLIDKVNLVARESLTGLMVVRAFGSEKYEEQRFDQANQDLTKVQLFVNRAMVFMMPIMNFIMSGLTLLIVWFGATQVDLGTMQVGNMMAFMQYAMQIMMSFLIIAMVFIMIPRAAVSATRIMEVIDTKLHILDPDMPKSMNINKLGEVSFQNVSFKYPNAEDYALQSINFTALAGQTTAIIGGTGSGKSTLLNLIPRLYDSSEGHILVNGIDVKQLQQTNLHEHLGYIPQKGVLFSGTIASNLRYGKQDASQQELAKAIEIAQAQNIIDEKPQHYDQVIAQGGSNVSGGQKQRLSIARALVKDPDIYLFDDSFSALDFKTDAALRKALKQQLSDKTLIIVAQRIGTIRDADQIIVLEDGMMVGCGTHHDLMKSCQVYQEIALSQLSQKELAYE